MEEQYRHDVIQTLITLGINDPNFLNNVREYPASTLSGYGLTLGDEELDEVFRYLIANVGLSNEEITSDLRERSEEGPGPRPSRW